MKMERKSTRYNLYAMFLIIGGALVVLLINKHPPNIIDLRSGVNDDADVNLAPKPDPIQEEEYVEAEEPNKVEEVQEEDANQERESDSDSNFDIAYVENNLETLDQKDPQLIQYARARYLTPPSQLEYNLDGETGYKKSLFVPWVRNFYGEKRDGIFIEAGANEGAKSSHSLTLERELGWTGLLVECSPMVAPILKSRHRRSWVAGACLAPSTTPGMLNFSAPTNWTYSGTLGQTWNIGKRPTEWIAYEVETIPLYTLLAAVGLKEIDFFLFDIEGQELAVLRTFPFEEVIFRVLIVEIYFYSDEEKQELDTLLTDNDYYFVKDVHMDKIYVHNSVKHMLTEDNPIW